MTCQNEERLAVMRNGQVLHVERAQLRQGDSTPFIPGFVYEIVPCCLEGWRNELDARLVRLSEGDPRWAFFRSEITAWAQ